jgi:hypothetical protein
LQNRSHRSSYCDFERRDIPPVVAKRIATGEANPNTHLSIEDINPSFIPHTTKPLPLASHDLNSSESKGKKAEKFNGANILSFFGVWARHNPVCSMSIDYPQLRRRKTRRQGLKSPPFPKLSLAEPVESADLWGSCMTTWRPNARSCSKPRTEKTPRALSRAVFSGTMPGHHALNLHQKGMEYWTRRRSS